MRTKTGIVTSAKMTGTVSVTVHRYVMHPKYAKRFRLSKKFLADNNGHTLHEGDEVVIGECRPLSKNKCFKVMEIKKKALQLAQLREEEIEKTTKRDHRDVHAEKSKDNASSSSAK